MSLTILFCLFVSFILGMIFDIVISHAIGGSRSDELMNDYLDAVRVRDELQRLLDSRPIFNNNLESAYTRWSNSVHDYQAKSFKAVGDNSLKEAVNV